MATVGERVAQGASRHFHVQVRRAGYPSTARQFAAQCRDFFRS